MSSADAQSAATTESRPVDDSFCRAVSQPGTPVTAYIAGRTVVAVAWRGRDWICTQDPDHQGSHAACDGECHVLARWPRRAGERYWQPGDCKDHDHGPPPILLA